MKKNSDIKSLENEKTKQSKMMMNGVKMEYPEFFHF